MQVDEKLTIVLARVSRQRPPVMFQDIRNLPAEGTMMRLWTYGEDILQSLIDAGQRYSVAASGDPYSLMWDSVFTRAMVALLTTSFPVTDKDLDVCSPVLLLLCDFDLPEGSRGTGLKYSRRDILRVVFRSFTACC